MIFDTTEKGYCLRVFNGVFLRSLDRWIRIDARGNKPGIQAQFSINGEILAFLPKSLGKRFNHPVLFSG